MRTLALLAPIATLIFFLSAPSTEGTESKAIKTRKEEVLFINGAIYVNATKKVTNLLIRNGKVIAHNVDVRDHTTAKIVDLKNAAAYPGFHDSHNHLLEASFGLSEVDLMHCKNYEPCRTADAIAEKISLLIDKIPDNSPIFGVGFSLEDYGAWSLKDLAKIDAATKGHPAIFIDNLGHNCIVNSVALKKYDVTSKTKIHAGTIVLENGQPTGMLREMAMSIVSIPMFEEFADPILATKLELKFFDAWAKLGYTSINDMMGGPMARMIQPEIFKQWEKEGKLPIRVNYAYFIFNLDDVDYALKYAGHDTELVRFLGVKILVDGGIDSGDGWTSWKNREGNNGIHYVTNDDTEGEQYNLNRIVERAEDLKLNIHYHTQGDKAVEAVLKALENVWSKKGRLSSKHTLVHLCFITDDQLIKLKKFGSAVNVTVQPALWKVEESDLKRYYPDHISEIYPLKKIVDSGITTGMSTDFSVTPIEFASPLTGMSIALHPQKWIPQSQFKPLTMKDLIHGFTAGSAATIPQEDTGTLEIGKSADIVIFNKDLYSILPENEDLKKEVHVISTWVAGKNVYSASIEGKN